MERCYLQYENLRDSQSRFVRITDRPRVGPLQVEAAQSAEELITYFERNARSWGLDVVVSADRRLISLGAEDPERIVATARRAYRALTGRTIQDERICFKFATEHAFIHADSYLDSRMRRPA